MKGHELSVRKNQQKRIDKMIHCLPFTWVLMVKADNFLPYNIFYDKTDCNDCQFNITAGFLPLIINGKRKLSFSKMCCMLSFQASSFSALRGLSERKIKKIIHPIISIDRKKRRKTWFFGRHNVASCNIVIGYLRAFLVTAFYYCSFSHHFIWQLCLIFYSHFSAITGCVWMDTRWRGLMQFVDFCG